MFTNSSNVPGQPLTKEQRDEFQKRLDQMLRQARANALSRYSKWPSDMWVRIGESKEADNEDITMVPTLSVKVEKDEEKLIFGTYTHPKLGKGKDDYITYDKSGVHFREGGMEAACEFFKKLGRGDTATYRLGSLMGRDLSKLDVKIKEKIIEMYKENILKFMKTANKAGLAVTFDEETTLAFIQNELSPKEQKEIFTLRDEMDVNRLKDKIHLGLSAEGTLAKYESHLDELSKEPAITPPNDIAESEANLKRIAEGLKSNQAIANQVRVTIDAANELLEKPEKLFVLSEHLRSLDNGFLSRISSRLESPTNKTLRYKKDLGDAFKEIKQHVTQSEVKLKSVLEKIRAGLGKQDEICVKQLEGLYRIEEKLKKDPSNPANEKALEKVYEQLQKLNELDKDIRKQKDQVNNLQKDHNILIDPKIYETMENAALVKVKENPSLISPRKT